MKKQFLMGLLILGIIISFSGLVSAVTIIDKGSALDKGSNSRTTYTWYTEKYSSNHVTYHFHTHISYKKNGKWTPWSDFYTTKNYVSVNSKYIQVKEHVWTKVPTIKYYKSVTVTKKYVRSESAYTFYKYKKIIPLNEFNHQFTMVGDYV